MNTVENDTNPPPVRYIPVPHQGDDEWLHFQAVHAVSGLPISCRTWAKLLSKHNVLAIEFASFLLDLHLDGMLLECRGTSTGSDASTTPFEFAIVAAPALEYVTEADPEPFLKQLFGSSTVAGEDCDGQDSVEIQWATESEENTGDNEDDGSSESSESSDGSSEEDEPEVPIGCVFSNLGGDATLVVPRPASKASAKDARFAHLASYVKATPLEEAGKLWSLVATEYEKKMVKHDASGEQRTVYLSTNGLGVSFLQFRLEHTPKYYNYKAFSQPKLAAPSSTLPDSTPLQIQIASDLHTEFYGLESTRAPLHLIVPRAPVLALLGDIGNACTDSLRAFLLIQAGLFEKVLFIVGNHEFYNPRNRKKSVAEQWDWLKSVCAERDNIYLLEKDSIDICGIRILGTALWSDIPDHMLRDAEMAMNDYALSYNHKEGEAPRNLTSTETRQWFRENLEWLTGELDRARQEGVPVMVLTHHTPQLQGTSHPRYAGDPLSHCFSSDLTDLLSFPVKMWSCGHTHYNFDMDFGGTRLLSNQRGYKGQANSNYRRDEVLEIHPIL